MHTSTRVADMVSSIGYFKTSNTDAGDQFGHSVSLSADGNTLAVGVKDEDSELQGIDAAQDNDENESAWYTGAVYVFTRINKTSATWSPQAYIKAKNTTLAPARFTFADEFGFSVALSADGGTLAVGAVKEDSNAMGVNADATDNSASNAGAVYVY